MNREKAKQAAIKEWRRDSDEYDFYGCAGLTISGFSASETDQGVWCSLSFKDSNKSYHLLISKNSDLYREING